MIRFDIKHSPLRFIHSALISLFILVLSGCQNMAFFPDFNETSPPQEIDKQKQVQVKAKSIEAHQFQLVEDQTLVGNLATVETQENDTLSDIARHFGLGYNDISRANPTIAPWTPQVGSHVVLPLQFILPVTAHKGIVLNLANMRLFYYPKQQSHTVLTYPVGIGRQGWNTPLGLTSIVAKTANPTWTVPESIHQEHQQKGDPLPSVVAAGPNNPLGLYAMRLGFPHYLIHGTNKPYGIGMQISHGCVQMYPEDIEVLFTNASIGMPVQIIHQPYLVGWKQDNLYLEANEPLQKWQNEKASLKKKLLKQIKKLSVAKHVSVDWARVDEVIQKSDGIPTPILLESSDEADMITHAIQLEHPAQLYQQPIVEELTDNDWSILVASFDNEQKAQELVTMLNHQGPMIPSRKIQKANGYQVIAGPFKNKKEVNVIAKRIRMDFELEVKPIKPNTVLN